MNAAPRKENRGGTPPLRALARGRHRVKVSQILNYMMPLLL